MLHQRLIQSAAAFAAVAYAYPNPGGCTGACHTHDPGLIQRESDGIYFLFSTGNEISYASAPTLAGPWTEIGSMLPNGSSIDLPGNTDLWAPDVHYINGLYYVYYAVSTFGSQDSAIGLATSETMDYESWTDHGSTGVESSSAVIYNAIDPNLIWADGSFYMNFGSFWDDIYQTKMNANATQIAGTPYNIAFDPAGTHAEEGSFMYHYGDFYYLFYSAGICCGYATSLPPPGQEYHVKVCRSTSPTGGFIDANGTDCTNGGGTMVLASHGVVYGPGGQGIYTDPHLGPVIYYHYTNTTVGYGQTFFGWNTLDFCSGWPVLAPWTHEDERWAGLRSPSEVHGNEWQAKGRNLCVPRVGDQ